MKSSEKFMLTCDEAKEGARIDDFESKTSALIQHYSTVSSDYHNSWFYMKDSPYEKWQLSLALNAFEASIQGENCLVCDLGGGTGRFGSLIHFERKLKPKVLCVDSSAEMLESAKVLDNVEALHINSLEFATNLKPGTIDCVLMKEMIHHIPDQQRPQLFAGLYHGLRPGGCCLVMTRPSEGIEYPFFKDAKNLWSATQPSAQNICSAMEAGGFCGAIVSEHQFPVHILKSLWLGMVADRFWSTLSRDHFSNHQLARGLDEVDTTYPADEDGMLRFNEKMVLIAARKPAAAGAEPPCPGVA